MCQSDALEKTTHIENSEHEFASQKPNPKVWFGLLSPSIQSLMNLRISIHVFLQNPKYYNHAINYFIGNQVASKRHQSKWGATFEYSRYLVELEESD